MDDDPAKTPARREKSQARPTDAEIVAAAGRQHDVISRSQLLEMGLSSSAIHRRVGSGWLYPQHPGVYAVGRPTLTRKGHWMAAVLGGGPGAVLSHRTAAALHQLRPSWGKTEVTVAASRHQLPQLRFHESIPDPDEVTTVENIPVTTAARTLLDLAAVLTTDQLTRAVEQAERLQLFDLRSLERAMQRRPKARGSATLRHVLDTYCDPAITRSELEREFLQLITQANLPTPLVNTIVAGYEVDICWPQFRLVVELDGRGYHSSPRAFEEDRLRDAALLRAGYRVLRITYRRLHEEPEQVLGDLLALVRLAA